MTLVLINNVAITIGVYGVDYFIVLRFFTTVNLHIMLKHTDYFGKGRKLPVT